MNTEEELQATVTAVRRRVETLSISGTIHTGPKRETLEIVREKGGNSISNHFYNTGLKNR